MAKLIVSRPFIFFSIVAFSLRIRANAAVETCWYGDLDNRDKITVIKCSDKSAVGDGTIESESLIDDNETIAENATTVLVTPSSGQLPFSAASCFVFKYFVTNRNDTAFSVTSVAKADFGCDFDDICKKKNVTTGKLKYNVKYKDKTGDLFCCSGEGCNDVHSFPGIPPQQQLCYDNSSRDGQMYCKTPDAWCTRVTRYGAAGTSESLACDDGITSMCVQYKLNTKDGKDCTNITLTDGAQVEVCCCPESKCFIPRIFSNIQSDSTTLTTSVQVTPTSWSQQPKFLIGGIVTGVIALCVISVVTVCLVYRKYQRESLKSRLSLSYAKIPASSSDGEDIRMLMSY